jgi:hypothetical protein
MAAGGKHAAPAGKITTVNCFVSVWHTFTTSPKTEDAESPVPVIETLADILSRLRELYGNPTSGPERAEREVPESG